MTGPEEVLRATLARCHRLAHGLEEVRGLLDGVLPFTGDDLDQLALAQRVASVALLKRIEQLEDMVGRLARATIDWTGGDAREMTQRDVANWMEKRGLVADADHWMKLVRLRNRLVHEYPIGEVEQVARVNESWTAGPALSSLAAAIERFLDTQGFPV